MNSAVILTDLLNVGEKREVARFQIVFLSLSLPLSLSLSLGLIPFFPTERERPS